MSKFCSNCGATLEDNVMFCSTCGTKQEAPVAPVAPAAPVYAAPVYAAPAAPVYEAPAAPVAPAAPAKKSKKGLAIGLVVGAVALIAIAVLVYFLFFSNPYKAAFDAADDINVRGIFDNYETMVPEGYWDYVEEEYYTRQYSELTHSYNIVSVDRNDTIDAAEDAWKEEDEEWYEDALGKDITYSYEIVKTVNMPADMVALLAESLEDDFGIEADRVQAAAIVVYHKTASSAIYADYDIYLSEKMIKVDGKWYFASWNYVTEYVEGKEVTHYDEYDVNFDYGYHGALTTKKDLESGSSSYYGY